MTSGGDKELPTEAEEPVAVEPPEPAEVRDPAVAAAAAVRAELDGVLPHVVRALKANEGVAALVARLDTAERRLAERDRRPLVSRVHRLLSVVRRLELPADVRETLLAEIEEILLGAGYTEFGEIGEPVVAGRHEVIDGEASSVDAVVIHVFEPGLETLAEVVVPARVRVGLAASHRQPLEEGIR